MTTCCDATVRWARARDFQALRCIDVQGDGDVCHEGPFADCLAGLAPSWRCLVATSPTGHQLGFLIFRSRPESNLVVRVAVALEHHRRGVGSQLLASLRHGLATRPRWHRDLTVACVREYDLPSQLFLRANGFTWRRTQPGGFVSPDMDGYCFAAGLEAGAEK